MVFFFLNKLFFFDVVSVIIQYTDALLRLTNTDDPLHYNYWKQQQKNNSSNKINISAWNLSSINSEINRLKEIKKNYYIPKK